MMMYIFSRVTSGKSKTHFGFLSVWLNDMTVKKLVLLIKDIDTNDVVERWQFDIQCDKSFKGDGYAEDASNILFLFEF